MNAPLTQSYNLSRLGNAGDAVRIEADAAQRDAIARLAEALSVPRFTAHVALSKLGPTRFRLDYRLEADIIQACVVTLEPVPAAIARAFSRELLFTGAARRKPVEVELSERDIDPDAPEEPEEIESLQYDLAAPALEEFLLALDPYPRSPGVAFVPGDGADPPPESPFAVLKSLKSRT